MASTTLVSRDPYYDSGAELPSLKDLLKVKKKSISTTPAPEAVLGGFKKASDLLRDEVAAKETLEIASATTESKGKPKAKRKTKTTVTKEEQDESGAKTRKMGKAIIAAETKPASEPTPKPVRSRKKKDEPQPIAEAAKEPEEQTSRFFDIAAAPSDVAQIESVPALEPVEQDRPDPEVSLHNKTRPKLVSGKTIKPEVIDLDCTYNTNSTIETETPDSMSDFRKAVHAYSYNAEEPAIKRPIEPLPLISRSGPIPSLQRTKSEPSPKKPPLKRTVSPIKKKQLTVTEKALEDFRPEEVPDNTSVLEYFPVAKAATTTDKPSKVKPAPRAKPRSRKKAEPKSNLLAPPDALQSLTHQDIVFGTSSQLMIPSSSPIQHFDAIHEKEASVSAIQREDSFKDIDSILGRSPRLLNLQSTSRLWTASTRLEDDSVLEVDVIPMKKYPAASAIEPSTIISAEDSHLKTDKHFEAEELSPMEARGRSEPILQATEPVPNATKALPPIPHPPKAIPSIPRSLGHAATRQRPGSKSPVKKKQRRSKEAEVAPMNPEDCFKKVKTDALRAEVKEYGHKVPRARKAMIEIILRCREEKTKTANGTTQDDAILANVVMTGNQAASTTLPAAIPELEEAPIFQTQAAPAPSQSKRKREVPAAVPISPPDQNDLPPPSFQTPLPASQSTASPPPDTAVEQTSLLPSITAAISLQPITHSIANPSWKEKIAMYDPIILEELTAWLNAGGLDAVGCDTEVEPSVVRDWCESKSVCFIWENEGWRKGRQGRGKA